MKRDVIRFIMGFLGLGCLCLVGSALYYYGTGSWNRSADNEVVQVSATVSSDRISVAEQLSADKKGSSLAEVTNQILVQKEDFYKNVELKEEAEAVTAVIDKNNDPRIPTKAKGIYVTGPMAGNKKGMQNLIDLVDQTELNMMVIDIKNDGGEITYKMDHPLLQEYGAIRNYVPNMEQLIQELKQKGVYLVARIVAFKDPILAKNNKEVRLGYSDGSVYKDHGNTAWVNPYKREVWDYLLTVADKAVDLGFDEIQFDYIRFPTDGNVKAIAYGKEANTVSKEEIITEFTKYVCEHLQKKGVFVSADVYGTVIDSTVDAKIVGQNYVEMCKYLDYICPMIYPSHYYDGSYGIQYPDLNPYQLIKSALDKSSEVLRSIEEGKHRAVVRPWLQDFTATWVKKHQTYGKKQIREQVQGVYDAGYEEWILWNGNNRYTRGGLLE